MAAFAVVQWQTTGWYIAAALLLTIPLAWLIFRPKGGVIQRVVIVALGLSVGLGYTTYRSSWYATQVGGLAGDTHRLCAVVAQWPEQSDYGYSVEVTLQLEEGTIGARLYVDEIGEVLQPGDEITVIARLSDASLTDNGEYYTYQIARGIFLSGVVYGEVEVIRPETIPLRYLPLYLSRDLQSGIANAFSTETAPFITALVTGEQDGLEDPFLSALQRAGMSHTVAVSGMHMVFLAGMVTLLMGRFRRRTAMVVIPVSVIFTLMVGASPSVVRACVMIIMIYIAPLLERESDGFTSLALALMVILLVNPLAIAHVGLQLSFASVVGIFCCSSWLFDVIMGKLPLKINRSSSLILRIVHEFARGVVAVLATSLGATVFTVPLVAYYFGYVSLISPIANILSLWAVAWCFGGGLLAGGVAMIAPQLGSHLAILVEPFALYFIESITALGLLPLAALPTSWDLAVVWLAFVYVVAVYWWWRKLKPALPLATILLALLVAVTLTVYENRQGEISVTVLDVGQGESVLLRMGETTALVDCGGDNSTVGDLAADAILSMGELTLDYLILTHCHLDHANGVTQLMERTSIGQLVLPMTEGEDEGIRVEILQAAEEHNIPVLLVDTTTELKVETGTITLFPPLGDGDENERGLTILASYNQFDTLITGDMGAEVEELLVDYTTLPIVEVYVVGHHGSNYSSSDILLDTITPEMAIISVGVNSFGHPAEEMLERLEKRNIIVYRTDMMGDITVRVGE